ncbi:MAG: N-acetyltransferase family protein [Acidimicrobiia bacterium]
MSTSSLPVADAVTATAVDRQDPKLEVRGGVAIRRLDRGDVAEMARLFDAMSPSGRYLRFLAPMPSIPAWFLERLADPDGVSHIVLVARADDRPIGEARFVRSSVAPDTAEFAVAVVDDHQRRGVARALLAALADEASRAGIRRFTFDVGPANRPMLSWLCRRGARIRFDEGVMTGDVLARAFLTHPPEAGDRDDLGRCA